MEITLRLISLPFWTANFQQVFYILNFAMLLVAHSHFKHFTSLLLLSLYSSLYIKGILCFFIHYIVHNCGPTLVIMNLLFDYYYKHQLCVLHFLQQVFWMCLSVLCCLSFVHSFDFHWNLTRNHDSYFYVKYAM